MQYNKFEYILAIAEERNLTQAAKKLFISQPALTIYINKLEEQLGVKLFDRSVSPIHITHAGEKYISEYQKILDTQSRLFHDLRAMSNEGNNYLSIGVGRNRGNGWLPQIMPEFTKHCPNVEVHILEATDAKIESNIVKGSVDIGIIAMPILSPDIDYIELVKEKIVICVPATHPLLKGKDLNNNSVTNPLHLQACELNDVTLICPSPGHGLYRCTQYFLNNYDFKPKNFITIDDSNTAFRLSAEGVGIVFSVADYANNLSDLKHPPIFCTLQDPLYYRTVVAAYRRGKSLSAPAKCLIEIINKIQPK